MLTNCSCRAIAYYPHVYHWLKRCLNGGALGDPERRRDWVRRFYCPSVGLWSVSRENNQDLLHLTPPFAVLPARLPAWPSAWWPVPDASTTGQQNSIFSSASPLPSQQTPFRPRTRGPKAQGGIFLTNGGKTCPWGCTSLSRGTSSAMQIHPPVKEEAEIYAPMQKHMLFIRGWHSHTRFQAFQDTALAVHSCFYISDLWRMWF